MIDLGEVLRKIKPYVLGWIEGKVTEGGGGGHTIQDEGTPLTARANLNFVGAGVAATDDAGNDRTVVTIAGLIDSLPPFWYVDGLVVAQATYGHSFIVPYDGYLNKVWLYAETPGTAGSTTIDIHKNAVTAYTTQANRPTLAYNDADNTTSSVPDITALVAGDKLTLDIDAAATGARNVTVVLDITRTAAGTQSVRPQTAYWTYEGELAVEATPFRIYNRTGYARTIKEVHLSVPVGSEPATIAIIEDVHLDGTTIFTNQAHRPQIAAGASTGYTTDIDVALWPNGSYLSVETDQIGSVTSPGANLVVEVISE